MIFWNVRKILENQLFVLRKEGPTADGLLSVKKTLKRINDYQ